MKRLWRDAATHFDGAGLEDGICNLSLRALLRQLEAGPNGRKLAGMPLAAAAEAAWPR